MRYNEQQEVSYINTIGNIVYHGSTIRHTVLKPHYSPVVDSSVVFAGPKWIALSFCGRWRDDIIAQGTVNGKPYLRELKKDVFKDVYGKGGWLHMILKTPDFYYDTIVGPYEIMSDKNVYPKSSRFVDDPIEEMRELGVDILYFS